MPGLGPWRSALADGATSAVPSESVTASIGERLEQVAIAAPDDPALSSPAGDWTYRQLLNDVERIAAVFTQRWPGKGNVRSQ